MQKIEALKLKVEWEKVIGYKFIGRLMGYEIHLSALPGSWAIWHIEKDGKVIDQCIYHKPFKGELSARLRSEKILLAIITNASES